MARIVEMPDCGVIYFVIATLVAYFLHHFYKPKNHSHHTDSHATGSNQHLQHHTSSEIPEKVSRKRKSLSAAASLLKRQISGKQFLKRSSSLFSNDDFECFPDIYSTFGELSLAMVQAGVQKARVVIGIDFTASNEWQGRRTFHKNSLHKINPVRANPYQKIVQIFGKVLEPFVEPNHIHAYGFGDIVSQDVAVFNLVDSEDSPCVDFKQVLCMYNNVAKRVVLSGPTSFAPLIKKTIELVIESNNKFHILFILADGQMEDPDPTLEALVDASNYPISIVMIGVGDGPWGLMEDCDDLLPARKFDNFQFVNFHESHQHKSDPDAAFALAALMEIPNQFSAMSELGYFKNFRHSIDEEEL